MTTLPPSLYFPNLPDRQAVSGLANAYPGVWRCAWPVAVVWSGKRDSNSRPRPWQGRALPTELFPHFQTIGNCLSGNLPSPLIRINWSLDRDLTDFERGAHSNAIGRKVKHLRAIFLLFRLQYRHRLLQINHHGPQAQRGGKINQDIPYLQQPQG
jgi:hypothetical protein